MQAKLTLFTLSLFLCFIANAQEWTPLNSGTTKELTDVFFINESKGWAVGQQGTILTTNDGGTNWAAQTSPVTSTGFTSVFFTSPTKGWVVGGKQSILTTDDGGNTWLAIDSGNQINYEDVFFVTPDTGYIAGSNGVPGIVKRTTNGGASWQTVAAPSKGIYAMHFLSGTRGWAVGSRGLVVYTDDAGASWTEQVAAGSVSTLNLICLQMLSETEGWAGGNPSAFKITANGSTWTDKASGTNAGKHDVHFTDSQNGWAVVSSSFGNDQPLRKTTNGGTTWTMDTLHTATPNALFFLNDTLGWAVGANGLVVRHGTPNIVIQPSAVTYLNEASLQLYPNPAGNYLNITCNEAIIKVEVFNLNGQLVLTPQATATIDVSPLAAGSYLIKLTTATNHTALKRFGKM
ncbi:MAG: YCF48-related protein [Chitinophagales bacterium]